MDSPPSIPSQRVQRFRTKESADRGMHRQTSQNRSDQHITLSTPANSICPRPNPVAMAARTHEPCQARGWQIGSIQAVQDRLELLLVLEVPCEVRVAIPSGYANLRREIRRSQRQQGLFSLIGECFSFHMNEQGLEAAYVATGRSGDGAPNVLELRGSDGRICATIVCPLASLAATWCDVWDSLIYAGRTGSRETTRGEIEYR